jgi:hypothetical protein
MSATNRKQSAKAHDKYPTDIRLVQAAFDLLTEHHPQFVSNATLFLEAGAGRGPFCEVARTYCRNLQCRPLGVELHPDVKRFDYQLMQQDFLCWKSPIRFDFQATNPPFTYAEDFIRKGLEMLQPQGMMLYLMRIGVAASVGRTELWEEVIKLKELWLIRRRPNFNTTRSGSSDATEYAYFLMTHRTRENAKVPTIFRWLDW